MHAFHATLKAIAEEGLLAFVKLALLYYSVPTFWHFVCAFPLTANGKTDRIVLRSLDSQRRTSTDSVVVMTSTVSSIGTVMSTYEVCQSPSAYL